MAKIVSGVNEITSNALNGRTVSDVRRTHSATLNIPTNATAFVDGEQVTNDYILEDGDELEFVRPAGTKGL